MLKQLIGLFLFLACLYSLYGQQSIQGIVIDGQENPLGFAHVTNQSLNMGKVSNVNGRFELLARKGDSITFSFVGFITESLVVESVHLTNYLKVKLTEDSLLLPSVTIYSDPYFKVPLNIKGESMEIAGIEKSEKEPIKPGSVGPGESGGVGLTLYGPITAFSKDAREQRKYSDAIESSAETGFYARFIETDSVKKKLCKIYGINATTFDRIIVSAHNQYPNIQTMDEPEEIWNWLLLYFDDVLN